MPVLWRIYDSATGAYHDVEATQEVYDFYRRNNGAIRRNNARFFAHEIQFTSLLGGTEGAFENVSEFISSGSDPQSILCNEETTKHLMDAFQCLPPSDQHLLYFVVVEGYTERWYEHRVGLHFMTVHNRKRSALQRLMHIIAG